MSASAFALPSVTDQAMQVLNQILGNGVIDSTLSGQTIAGSKMSIIASMLLTFNQMIFGLSLAVVIFMLVIGTINSAHEGKLLGRSMNSTWSLVRIGSGIGALTPLSNGLCLAQKIVLYLILIGAHIASVVWGTTIINTFENKATPPIPSFLYQQALNKVENEFVTAAVQQIADSAFSSSLHTLGPAQLKSPPPGMTADTVQEYMNDQYMTYTPQTSGPQNYDLNDNQYTPAIDQAVMQDAVVICKNLFPSVVASCINVIQSGVVNHVATMPVSTTGTVVSANGKPVDIAYTIGLNGEPGVATVTGGGITYVFPSSTSGSSATSGSGSGSGSSTSPIQTTVNSIISTYVLGGATCQSTDNNCNMATQTTNIIDNLSSDLFTNCTFGSNGTPGTCLYPKLPVGGPPTSGYSLTDSIPTGSLLPGQNPDGTYNYYIGTTQQEVCTTPASGGATTCTPQTVNTIVPNFQHFYIPGLRDTGASPNNSNDWPVGSVNPTNDGHAYVDLTNSWWLAGSVYLSIDQEISDTLEAMEQKLDLGQDNSNYLTSVVTFTNETVESGLAIEESSYLDLNGANLGACGDYFPPSLRYLDPATLPDGEALGGFSGLSSSSTWTSLIYPFNAGDTAASADAAFAQNGAELFQDCYHNFARLTGNANGAMSPLEFSETVNPNVDGTIISETDWNNDINAAYGPAGLTPNPQVLNDLNQIPAEFRAPIAALLQLGVSSDPTTYSKTLAPYLASIYNVLNANNLTVVQQAPTVLPISNMLNEIFNNLLTSHGDSATSTTSNSESAQSAQTLFSVMEQVYNIGIPTTSDGITGNTDGNIVQIQGGGVISQQFNMVRQIQAAGVSMITAVTTAIQDVYKTFYGEFQHFKSTIKDVAGGVGGGGLGLGTIVSFFDPAIGGAIASASISAAQLTVQILTVTTMMSMLAQLIWLPIALFVMAGLFMSAIQFILFVPLIPYILFWAGQIAWIIGVLEALVAAPLLMLALAYPGGHEYAGHMIPGFKMLIGVIFRPVLMVIGLIAGILLTFVVIKFSAQGFHLVAASLLNAVNNQTVAGIISIMLLFTYCTFIVMAFTKCFSLIYVIPEKVVQWIGGQAERAGQEDLQQMSSSVQQSSQQMSQAGQQAVQGSTDMAKQDVQMTSQAASTSLSSGNSMVGTAQQATRIRQESNRNKESTQKTIQGGENNGDNGGEGGGEGGSGGSA